MQVPEEFQASRAQGQARLPSMDGAAEPTNRAQSYREGMAGREVGLTQSQEARGAKVAES